MMNRVVFCCFLISLLLSIAENVLSFQVAVPSFVVTSERNAFSSIINMKKDENDDLSSPSLATLFTSTVVATTLLFSVSTVEPAYALKPRNEALCSTGFFTNIAQRMCTDLGDITDEGYVRELSDTQSSTADSLLSKFNLDSDDAFMDETNIGGQNKESSKSDNAKGDVASTSNK